MNYQIEQALGHYVIIEPFEKSTVLQADETATVFKIISLSEGLNFIETQRGWTPRKERIDVGDIILVKRSSVDKMPLPNMDVWYVYYSDIVAKLKHD